MLTILAIIGLYVVGAICFALWDAYIGLGVGPDDDNITIAPILFWPVALSIIVVFMPIERLNRIKAKRRRKAEREQLMRISMQQEQEAVLMQIEREMLEDKPLNRLRELGYLDVQTKSQNDT